MKILKIILSNIHSLRGKHEIDFDNGVLQNAGLYAITGQTGAGKSTILDAITLALYGQTNRHGDRNYDNEILTRNEKEAFAEVTFEVNNQTYMARWEVSMNRNNNLNASKRCLYLKNELILNLLADHKGTCQNEINKIVGLNFEQFSKSILLAQNNFSAFLKAKPTERAEMLSKITGTEIYERISMAVFENTKVLECEITATKSQLKVDLFSVEDIELFETELKTKSSKTAENETKINGIATQIKWFQDVAFTNDELINQKSDLTQLETKILANSDDYTRLATYNKAVLLEKDLLAVENAENQLQNNEKSLLSVELEIEKTKENIVQNTTKTQLKSTETQLTKGELDSKLPDINEAKIQIEKSSNQQSLLLDLAKECTKKQEDLQKSSTLKLSIDERKNVCLNAIGKYEIQEKEYKIYSTWNEEKGIIRTKYKDIEAIENTIFGINPTEVDSKISDLKYSMEKINRDFDSKKNELLTKESDLLDSLERRKILKSSELLFKENELARKHLNLWEDLANELKSKAKVNQKFTVCSEKNGLLVQQQLFDNETFGKQQLMVKILTENVTLLNKIKSLEVHRSALEEGKDCPLCGSIHHPYASENKIINHTKSEEELDIATQLLEKLRKKIIELGIEKASNETELKIIKAEYELHQKQIEKLNLDLDITTVLDVVEIENKCSEINNSIESIQKSIEINTQLDNQIQLKQQNVNILKDGVQKLTESQTTIEKQIVVANETLQLYKTTSENIEKMYVEIQSVFDIFGKKLANNSKVEIVETGTLLLKNYNLWEDATKNLKSLTQDLNSNESELKVVEEKICTSNNDFIILKEKLKEAENSYTQILLSITNLTQNFVLKKPQEEENRIRVQLKNLEQELSLLINAQSGFQATLLQYQKNQAALNFAKTNLENTFISTKEDFENLLKSNDFNSKELLKNALILPNHAILSERKIGHENEKIRLQSLVDANQKKLENLTKLNLSQSDLANLVEEKEQLILDNQQNNQYIGGIIEKLDNYKVEFAANEKLNNLIKSQENTYLKWEQLNKLIGSKTGDSFKKFAQDFTLSLLVQFANRHLEIMHNRYQLHKDDDSTEMELQIKDKYFFEQVRSVNSLSGGETFLVSLALALGLSDLASKNTKIRSLFIDEGFGSLDPESLNNALDALELIRQTDDRQIGIISHVEELKKRITTQIKVTKTSSEFSKIEICDN